MCVDFKDIKLKKLLLRKLEMKNPFEEKKEKEKYEFFHQMTSAINDWMLKQYPEFDQQLVDKINELKRTQNELKRTQIEINNHFHERKKELEAIKERHLNFITAQINEFLKKDYPDVSRSLCLSAKELEKAIKVHDQNSEKIRKKLDTVIKSDSLYEDVYKMRDEFKEIKKFIESFSKKIKKAFEV